MRRIWLADLVRSVHELEPDEGTEARIASLLGFGARIDPAPDPEASENVNTPSGTSSQPSSEQSESTTGDPSVRLAAIARLRSLPPLMSTGQSTGIETAADLSGVQPLQLSVVDPRRAAPITPLLSARAGRAIVQELVSSDRVGQEPDVARIIDRLARYELPDPIPRLIHRTLARGVQVLIDRGEGMEPFAADQEAFVGLLEDVVGADLVTVQTIYEAPDRVDPSHPWSPPPPGTPILTLTDLGLGGRSELGAAKVLTLWREAVSIATPRRSTITALVPYVDRLPAGFAGLIDVVEWDRPTTASIARIARRPQRSR